MQTEQDAIVPVPDPYEAYFEWCKANGFEDVADCEPEDVDVLRMDESIAAYGMANTCVSDGPADAHKSTSSAEGPFAARNG